MMFEKIEDVSFVFYFVRHAPNMKPFFYKESDHDTESNTGLFIIMQFKVKLPVSVHWLHSGQ